MILVYTGDGKGKTSACVGQALRALGQGMTVAFGQFMKRDGQAGEQVMLSRLLGDRFLAGGLGFLRNPAERPAHRQAALKVLSWAQVQLADCDMLLLDEALYALCANLLTREDVETLLHAARREKCHLVLSGRNVPGWLVAVADLVTSMTEVKHPWQQGITATKGIEF